MRETIEKNFASVLPHLKFISAHGTGELFASKHILKQLGDWRPIAPPEEISVSLETNGSLFDEKHWKQISNLGQYNLSVAITVMSFDEHVYQILSGARLPIAKLEDNLRFVKSLREKGIINRLQIATVVQERNFRMLPEFTRRCIEEFGADSVRLRPYIPYDHQTPPEIRFFADTKNVNHPYHEEYAKIFEDPIFKHPKVDNWGTVDKTYKYELPYKAELENIAKLRFVENKFLVILMTSGSILDKLKMNLQSRGKSVIVFGARAIGLSVAKKLVEIGCNVSHIISFEQQGTFLGIPVVTSDKIPIHFRSTPILFTDLEIKQETLNILLNLGYNDKFIGLQSLLENE